MPESDIEVTGGEPSAEAGKRPERILLTGATGYVGGRLLGALLGKGMRVRCLARHPGHLRARVPAEVEVVAGDVLDRASLDAALDGVDVAYYLVHSMSDRSGFEERELAGARNFAGAAAANRLQRIVYLGGLGDERQALSPHLRSRHLVGRVLRDSGVPTIEFRASIIIGSGSLSFEMVRALTEHLPVMIAPRWVSVLAQPIAIRDLVAYLVEALDVPLDGSVVVEIGGADRVSYGGLIHEYAKQRGLRRAVIPVPLLTPALSALWLGLVTPLYARVGRKLIESIKHPTVVTTETAARMFAVRPIGAAAAVRAALAREDREYAETHWSDAVSASGQHRTATTEHGGLRLVDRRDTEVGATPRQCLSVIAALGGRAGWPSYGWMWRIRGLADLLVGGVGMRRVRPEGRPLRVGDVFDFWRVERYEPNERLRLEAEMKMPGRAWLEFEVTPTATGSHITQTAIFDPAGLGGRLYWYLLIPAHALIFRGMLNAIARRAVAAPA